MNTDTVIAEHIAVMSHNRLIFQHSNLPFYFIVIVILIIIIFETRAKPVLESVAVKILNQL